jgi:3-oxoacyl-[acyl-carrier-protein] synthase III
MKSHATHGITVSITGTGSYLPSKVLTNADLEKMVDTTDEWISQRTGIKERHIAHSDEATSDMSAEAAKRALASAGVDASEVEMIIVATITPDMVFPNTACLVQEKIGAKKAFCFDLEAACSGFLYGLEIARQFISSGTIKTALVIGAEKLSCITDWEDRNTCVLFGDGAGAAVVQAGGHGRGLMASSMGSDGRLAHLLNMPGGGSRHPASVETVQKRLHYLKMEGREVFKHAVRCMCDAGQTVLKRCNLTPADIKYVIPHQANMRIIEAISDRIGVPLERFRINMDKVGNTSAASIPLALDEAVRGGLIKKGDVLLFVAFGGGFTWGAMALEWEK